ncbi:MAG TPA: hypothetical protein VMW79_05990 [Anaerolineae bacterium]|nr:hypothetical protein [Anaerolineae bacterium]HUW96017.1 hypothetical protein [Anaerolineae bacterium]
METWFALLLMALTGAIAFGLGLLAGFYLGIRLLLLPEDQRWFWEVFRVSFRREFQRKS